MTFAGYRSGEELSRYYSASDAFVFPSRFETFGLVLLEALACGLPVAAYPVHGPQDVIGPAPVGVLDDDLRRAALEALSIPRESCRAFAMQFSWRRSAEEFLANLVPHSLHPGDAVRGRGPGRPDITPEDHRPRARLAQRHHPGQRLVRVQGVSRNLQ